MATTPEGAVFLLGDVVRVRPTFSHLTVSRVKTLGRRRRSWRRVLLEGVVVRAMWRWAPLGCVGSCRWRAPLPPGGSCSGGNPRSRSPGSDDVGDFGVVLPPGGVVLEQWFTGEANRLSGVTSTVLKTVGLDGVEQWSLRVGRRLIDARKLVALSGVVVTSTTDGTGKIYAVILPEDGMAEDGGGGSLSVRRRCMFGTPRPDGLKTSVLDCVCYADRAHLYTCRCSDFVRLEGGFGLILVFILSDSGE